MRGNNRVSQGRPSALAQNTPSSSKSETLVLCRTPVYCGEGKRGRMAGHGEGGNRGGVLLRRAAGLKHVRNSNAVYCDIFAALRKRTGTLMGGVRGSTGLGPVRTTERKKETPLIGPTETAAQAA